MEREYSLSSSGLQANRLNTNIKLRIIRNVFLKGLVKNSGEK